MRGFSQWAVAATGALSFIGQSLATPVPVVVEPGDVSDIVVTSDNTVNGTSGAPSSSPSSSEHVALQTAGTAKLPLSIVNHYGSGSINVYVSGIDSKNNVVLLRPDGSFYYPPSTTSTTPVAITVDLAIPIGAKGSTTTITIPDYISSGRVWFAVGDLKFYTVASSSGGVSLVEPSAVNPDDPSADINWGFVELTNTANGGLYANISYVDWVGLVLGMSLLATDNTTQTALGLEADAVTSICNDLKTTAASDGQPWDQLCMTNSSGHALRVLSPNDYMTVNKTAFVTYYDDYVNKVWTKYSTQTLTIDTQASAGKVACTVSGNTLNCTGDNRGFSKPKTADIFGCNSGPFLIETGDNDVHRAIVPRLCAAFDRTTLLLDGGNVQPSLSAKSYYTVSPSNFYSQIVHKYEVDGKGYAFSYDDVNSSDENASGVVSSANPSVLTITVGGPST